MKGESSMETILNLWFMLLVGIDSYLLGLLNETRKNERKRG